MAQSKTESSRDTMTEPRKERRGWSWWHLLLLIQFVAVLWPPFCNSLLQQRGTCWLGVVARYLMDLTPHVALSAWQARS